MKEYTAKYNQAMNLLVRDGAYCNDFTAIPYQQS